MNIQKIKFLVKQVRYQEIEISEENGFDMPETIQQVIDLNKQIEFAPESFTNAGDWNDEESEAKDVKFIESNNLIDLIELKEFRAKAFEAHPNIDIDIENLKD